MEFKLGNKNNAECKTIDTLCLTFKIVIPHKFSSILDNLYNNCNLETRKMLENRDKRSTKYYKSIPSVVAKALIKKYQSNKKLKKINRLVIPIIGEKGVVVKRVSETQVRIPALFKKESLEVPFPRPMVGHIRCVEFFKRNGNWFMSYSYNVLKEEYIEPTNCIGVDRNSVGNVVTVSSPEGVKFLGPDCSGLNKNWLRRRANLQKKGAKNALKKIKRKQTLRTKDINHKVSKELVNIAKEHRSAIVLEDLKGITKGKTKGYVTKSQWSFYQLETFIKYKAALHGVPVLYVSPRFTSQRCAKCGQLNKPSGKKYKCSCGYVAHRDANAAINIRMLGEEGLSSNRSGLIGDPLNRTVEVAMESESSGGAR